MTATEANPRGGRRVRFGMKTHHSHDRRDVSNRALRAVVDEIGPDDGIDPRLEARARPRSRRRATHSGPAARTPGRKTLQLGRQVAETLTSLLAGETHDEQLQGLRVARVEPAPATSRFLGTQRLARLRQASGWIRSELAVAICRKRVPSLAFRLAPDVEPETDPGA